MFFQYFLLRLLVSLREIPVPQTLSWLASTSVCFSVLCNRSKSAVFCAVFCLYVRVLRHSDAILEQDRKVPEHCWNASISKDICEAQTGVLLGTFSIDLLSDTEFLVYKLPKTGRGMTYAKSLLFVELIRGGYLWGGIPADVFVA